VEVLRTAVALMVRSMVLSARSAGQQRLLFLEQSAGVGRETGGAGQASGGGPTAEVRESPPQITVR